MFVLDIKTFHGSVPFVQHLGASKYIWLFDVLASIKGELWPENGSTISIFPPIKIFIEKTKKM